MQALCTAITRLGIIALTGALIIALKQPGWIALLILLAFTRRKETRRTVTEEFDIVHQRLDALTGKADAAKEAEKQP